MAVRTFVHWSWKQTDPSNVIHSTRSFGINPSRPSHDPRPGISPLNILLNSARYIILTNGTILSHLTRCTIHRWCSDLRPPYPRTFRSREIRHVRLVASNLPWLRPSRRINALYRSLYRIRASPWTCPWSRSTWRCMSRHLLFAVIIYLFTSSRKGILYSH